MIIAGTLMRMEQGSFAMKKLELHPFVGRWTTVRVWFFLSSWRLPGHGSSELSSISWDFSTASSASPSSRTCSWGPSRRSPPAPRRSSWLAPVLTSLQLSLRSLFGMELWLTSLWWHSVNKFFIKLNWINLWLNLSIQNPYIYLVFCI